jgi:lipopolysaccharide transport system permease protein
VPLSLTISNLFQFGIKILLLVIFIIYFQVLHNVNIWVIALPLLILLMALIAMGMGMIITALTTKYRDLSQLMVFAVGLFMYVTPVIYPTSMFLERFSKDKHWMIYANPLTSIFDIFRYSFLGTGIINVFALVYSVIFSLVVFLVGLLIFNRVEKSFMDNI